MARKRTISSKRWMASDELQPLINKYESRDYVDRSDLQNIAQWVEQSFPMNDWTRVYMWYIDIAHHGMLTTRYDGRADVSWVVMDEQFALNCESLFIESQPAARCWSDEIANALDILSIPYDKPLLSICESLGYEITEFVSFADIKTSIILAAEMHMCNQIEKLYGLFDGSVELSELRSISGA